MISCFLAKTFPDARIVSIDRCAAAIEIAKAFAKKQGLENIAFLCCDLKEVEGSFDTVFSMRTLHENNEAEEDVVNDLGEQAAVFREALPERDDFSEQMEVRENRRELEQVMDAAIEAVTQKTDEQQPVQDASKQKHDQER